MKSLIETKEVLLSESCALRERGKDLEDGNTYKDSMTITPYMSIISKTTMSAEERRNFVYTPFDML